MIDVRDPATDLVIGQVPDLGVDAAVAATSRANAALDAWRQVSPRGRADVLSRVRDLMLERHDELASIIVSENGKSGTDASGEVHYAAEFFRWYAEEAVRISGTYGEAPSGGSRMLITRRPAGVAALVTPWNFPAAMIARKVAPALAAGCTVVLKPAEETPLTAVAMGQIFLEAGVPDDAVEIVTTTRAPEVVAAWLGDSRVRKVSFTGSTAVGKALLRRAADRVLLSSMELGGNAPFIVASDVDMDACLYGAIAAKFRGGGQACTAANTFYIHRRRLEEFTDRFGEAIEGFVVGPGAGPATQVGPVISRRAAERIEAAVAAAVAGGATITHRAPVPQETGGYYVAPMVVRDPAPDASLLTDELFGPVAPVVGYDDIGEVISAVNRLEYGLSAYVYSQDLQWSLRVADRLECGMVGINRGVISDPAAPFGGMKESGLGREGAAEGLAAFLETQYISVDWSGV